MKSGHRAKKIIQGRENHVCQSLRRARRVQGTKGRPGWLCRGVYTEERARWQWGPGTTGLCRLGKEIHTEGTKTVPQHSSTHSCPDVTTKITLWLKIRARRALEDDLTHTWPLGSNHHLSQIHSSLFFNHPLESIHICNFACCTQLAFSS